MYTINGTTVTDEERIANKMNDYFVNIGSTLAKKIPYTSGDYRDYLTSIKTKNCSMFIQPTDCYEVIAMVNELKANKAPGYDDISPKMIKLIISYIAPLFLKSLICHYQAASSQTT